MGAVAYIACSVLWIFGVFLGYEVLYSYYRRWRFREYSRLDVIEDMTYCLLHLGRPLILPIYLSSSFQLCRHPTTFLLSPARLLGISLCQLERGPPFSGGSLRDALAETCHLLHRTFQLS
jgi:hypothetical protein